jgi:FdhD protein
LPDLTEAPAPGLPRLTQAQAPLTQAIKVVNEFGETRDLEIPAERALTVYIDKRELVTLMTLGAKPEWLVLGYLLNQRLIRAASEVESITVDWEVGAAAVKTHHGIANLAEKTAKRVVTTGCGQGSVFGELMADVDTIALPPATLTQSALYGIVNAIRLHDSVYKAAGSVHGCALFKGDAMLMFVEDVGRHNAIDAIAGWMALQPSDSPADSGKQRGQHRTGLRADDKVFYTTGRLTSEMVIKSAQMGVPIVISRSGITQMGHAVAQRLNLCAIGRATNKRFLCFSAQERLVLDVTEAASGVV